MRLLGSRLRLLSKHIRSPKRGGTRGCVDGALYGFDAITSLVNGEMLQRGEHGQAQSLDLRRAVIAERVDVAAGIAVSEPALGPVAPTK